MWTQVTIIVKQFQINLQIIHKKKSGDQFPLCKQLQIENRKGFISDSLPVWGFKKDFLNINHRLTFLTTILKHNWLESS